MLQSQYQNWSSLDGHWAKIGKIRRLLTDFGCLLGWPTTFFVKAPKLKVLFTDLPIFRGFVIGQASGNDRPMIDQQSADCLIILISPKCRLIVGRWTADDWLMKNKIVLREKGSKWWMHVIEYTCRHKTNRIYHQVAGRMRESHASVQDLQSTKGLQSRGCCKFLTPGWDSWKPNKKDKKYVLFSFLLLFAILRNLDLPATRSFDVNTDVGGWDLLSWNRAICDSYWHEII